MLFGKDNSAGCVCAFTYHNFFQKRCDMQVGTGTNTHHNHTVVYIKDGFWCWRIFYDDDDKDNDICVCVYLILIILIHVKKMKCQVEIEIFSRIYVYHMFNGIIIISDMNKSPFHISVT